MKKRYGIEVDHAPSCECGEYHWIIWEYNDDADAKVERSNSGMCGYEPTKLHAMTSALEASEKLKEK